jgi:beta-phosphoglucomutase
MSHAAVYCGHAHRAAQHTPLCCGMARAVIFDFDGVIVHSEPTHLLAVREVLGPLGLSLSEQVYYAHYVHLPDRELLRRAARDQGIELSDAQLQDVLAQKHAAFARLNERGGVGVYPGVLELIRACQEQVPVALCTAAERATVRSVLSSIGASELFEIVTTANDVARSKPDPLPYARTCELLGLAPGSCVAIEDTAGGASSAKGAGCVVVAVGHTMPRERLTHADHFVERIADLTAERLLSL